MSAGSTKTQVLSLLYYDSDYDLYLSTLAFLFRLCVQLQEINVLSYLIPLQHKICQMHTAPPPITH